MFNSQLANLRPQTVIQPWKATISTGITQRTEPAIPAETGKRTYPSALHQQALAGLRFTGKEPRPDQITFKDIALRLHDAQDIHLDEDALGGGTIDFKLGNTSYQYIFGPEMVIEKRYRTKPGGMPFTKHNSIPNASIISKSQNGTSPATIIPVPSDETGSVFKRELIERAWKEIDHVYGLKRQELLPFMGKILEKTIENPLTWVLNPYEEELDMEISTILPNRNLIALAERFVNTGGWLEKALIMKLSSPGKPTQQVIFRGIDACEAFRALQTAAYAHLDDREIPAPPHDNRHTSARKLMQDLLKQPRFRNTKRG